ncbi:unnamed protein product [Pleuronectes platessa]|uniref:Uncharacterized protein n=1 Tax=Pleuronectes platessa TaxID=8262 RepID=A0A9N7V1K9_PLEPL|nr:unnamed protein product [Pleuronectes platessa]
MDQRQGANVALAGHVEEEVQVCLELDGLVSPQAGEVPRGFHLKTRRNLVCSQTNDSEKLRPNAKKNKKTNKPSPARKRRRTHPTGSSVAPPPPSTPSVRPLQNKPWPQTRSLRASYILPPSSISV